MSRMLILLLGLLAAWPLGAGAGQDPVQAFAEANRLYEQGKFAEAALAYDALHASGVTSPALWFNLGNAWFKSGQTGRAIAAYREAARLAPRDPDVQANLKFARESAGTRSAEPAWWRRRPALSLDEWAWLTTGALWLWLGLLTVGLWRPAWRQPLLPWRRLALAGLTIIAVMAVRAVREELNGRTAVVIVPEAVVRYGPLEESQSQFTLRDGAEVEVLDRHADWAQIRDAQRRTGWIKTQHLILPGANGRETS